MRKYLILFIILSSFLFAPEVFSDSCPYCGMSYGDAAPGDESRVYALRADHEASCSSNSGGGGGYSSGGGGGWTYQDQRRWEEEQRLLAIEAEIERQRIEAEKRRQRLAAEAEEDMRKEEELAREWNIDKVDLRDALKGKRDGDLTMKTTAYSNSSSELSVKDYRLEIKKQEDYYKSLKTEKVPSPVITSSEKEEKPFIDKEKIEKAKKDWEKMNISGKTKYYFWRGIDKINETKRNVVEWVKSRSFEETFNRVPFASELKSMGGKMKGWYTSMKDLATGIFKDTSDKMNKGISELGDDKIYTGSDDDKSTERTGEEAKRKAGKMAGDELEGKGMF